MKISIDTIESTNFGDHGERCRRSHEQVEGETVEDLVRRVFPKLGGSLAYHDATDEIVIRVVVEADGKVSGQGERPEAAPF